MTLKQQVKQISNTENDKGSRMRKPVPPPVAAEDLWLAEVRGKQYLVLVNVPLIKLLNALLTYLPTDICSNAFSALKYSFKIPQFFIISLKQAVMTQLLQLQKMHSTLDRLYGHSDCSLVRKF